MKTLRTRASKLSRPGLFGRLNRQDGHSLVALSFVLPLLMTPLLAVVEFGPLFYASIEVANAARAGAAYGAQNLVTASDSSGMVAAAKSDGSDILNWRSSGLTATATQYCVCASGTATSCASAASNCASPTHALQYVQVATQEAYAPPVRVPGLPTSFTLRGQAIMRVN